MTFEQETDEIRAKCDSFQAGLSQQYKHLKIKIGADIAPRETVKAHFSVTTRPLAAKSAPKK